MFEVVVQYELISNAGPNSLDSVRVQIDAKDSRGAEDAARKLIRRRYGVEIKNVHTVESSWIRVS